MKCLCALLLATLLAGCATDADPETRRFFNRGWVNPRRDIDDDPYFGAPEKDPAGRAPAPPRHYQKDPLLDY